MSEYLKAIKQEHLEDTKKSIAAFLKAYRRQRSQEDDQKQTLKAQSLTKLRKARAALQELLAREGIDSDTANLLTQAGTDKVLQVIRDRIETITAGRKPHGNESERSFVSHLAALHDLWGKDAGHPAERNRFIADVCEVNKIIIPDPATHADRLEEMIYDVRPLTAETHQKAAEQARNGTK